MQEQAPWLIANRYEVGEVVGRGGYGMVCRGVDRVAGGPVALKMLSPEAGKDPDVVERMLREQQALVALSGTCAVTAIDLCRLDSGAPCLVMEWLDGRDLEQEVSEWEARGGVGDVAGLVRLLEPLTQTLARAHEIGLIHRDIKPANIFVTKGPEPGTRLLDFGLSRMKSAAPLTQLGMVMGSPSYIAPETWRGNSSALDGRADLFSLAVIAFRWLTGKLPFDAPDLLGKMNAVTSGPRPSVVALRPDLPAALDGWMARALAVEPDARFQTATDFYAAFAAAVNGQELTTASANAGAEISGTRLRMEPPSVGESDQGQGPLVAAWRRAAALLKRFTGTRDSAVPLEPAPKVTPSAVPAAPSAVPPTPSAVPPALSAAPSASSVLPPALSAVPPALSAVPPALSAAPSASSVLPPASQQRPSIWLDSSELEDATDSVRVPAAGAVAALPVASHAAAPSAERKGKGKARGKRKSDAKPGKEGKTKSAGKKARRKERKKR